MLHCHSDYPTKIKDVNLLAMKTLSKKTNLAVGYSDHTTGVETAIACVALGGTVIEKHITLNKKMSGPDHKASMNPEEFSKFVSLIRNTESLLGSYEKRPTTVENLNKKLVRKSIVAKKLIKKGEYFSEKNITSKRPEGGLSPIYWDYLIGKKSKKSFSINEFISLK